MLRLIREIATLTGESQPRESFRKFLIRKPSEEDFQRITAAERSDILQTYLTSEPGKERRVRQRGNDGIWVYTMTTKTEGHGAVSKIETEHRITEREYINLLMEADTSVHQIRKTRWCVPYESAYFEIDVFPFSDEYAVLEVELVTKEDEFEFPSFIEVIREVTDDKAYRNKSLAASQRL
jgi:CYTH domain-containing protein